ncbi:MAG: GTPase Era [Candidatus Shapirobacteria bacterium]
MKAGNVVLVGRPNAGKSTLINSLVKQKISIVTNKPQTTRRNILGYWWDENHQIVFWDTPGIFKKAKGFGVRKINLLPQISLASADVAVYLIDSTRFRGEEENKSLGMVRKINKPKIIAINKIDSKKENFIHQYTYLKEEFDDWVEISALKEINLKTLLEKIKKYLPENPALFDPEEIRSFPSNLTPKEFVGEIIREKAFKILFDELPYTVRVQVEELTEKKDLFYVKADILTTDKRYRKMIIGAKGKNIKEIGTLARKELELITNKKVFLDLEVKTANSGSL